jgi:hypothetical protein
MVLRWMSLLCALSLALISTSPITAISDAPPAARPFVDRGEGDLPTFSDYPAKGKFKGKIAKAKIKTPAAKMYRTAITEGAKEGPNFAGHYTITTWGCGASCHAFAIVDANTGTVYTQDLYVVAGLGLDEDLQNRPMLDYRPDSRLLIVTGSRNETSQGQYFYKWENNRLVLIRSAFEVKD